ncbi:MAG TPA: RDD family protein [Verrucomicrobiaceae bacterium]
MEYFLSIAGERTGPHSQFHIIEEIRDGRLKGDELAWRRGMGEWKPLREFEEFSGYWRPTPEQIVAAEHVRQVARIALDTPQPWLRFWARAMDYVWFYLLLCLLFNILIPTETTLRLLHTLAEANPALKLFVSVVILPSVFGLFIPLEALWLSRRGTTPGKALLRIQVRRLDGALPDYAQALQRSALVFIKGMAFCLPIVPLFVMSWCRIRLLQLGMTSWDEHTGLRVEHGEPEPWRYLIVAIIAGFVALIFAVSLAATLEGSPMTPPLPK